MSEFSLDIKEITQEVENTIKTEEENLEKSEIQKQAENNAIAIFKADLDKPNERQTILKPLEDFGLSTINRSQSRNKLLSNRIVDFEKSGDDNASDVGEKLSELNVQMKDLDPSMLDFTKKGILGNIFNPVRKYFNRYQRAEAVIANIIKSLDRGSKTLQNDNATLLAEESHLRDLTKKLLTDIELGKMMDESIEVQIKKAELEDVEETKISFVREEVLFPLRQRIMDMQQMIVVNQQGIVSLNIVRRNNKELIRGVDRAKNVTITALRTGVMVASALYNQKIVLEKIQTLNKTTESIIESTSHMLREQGSKIQKMSMETMISPEVLKSSFADAMAAIEDVSKYKEQALPKMKETIDLFHEMAQEGQEVVDKIEIEGVGLK